MTRAAARLGIQQPPLTHQIQLLEKELNLKLFSRSPKKIELNAAGRVFLEDARHIIDLTAQAVERVRKFHHGTESVLRVGLTSSSLMHRRTQALLEMFRQQHPQVQLRVDEGHAIDLLAMLDSDQIDVALLRSGMERFPQMRSQLLAQEEMVMAVPQRHPLAQSSQVDIADLRCLNLVLYRVGDWSGLADTVLAACEREGFMPHVVDETRRLMSAVNMVAAGIGVTIVPLSVATFQPDAVAYIPLAPGSRLTAPLHMAFRNHEQKLVLQQFLALAERVVDGLTPGAAAVEVTSPAATSAARALVQPAMEAAHV